MSPSGPRPRTTGLPPAEYDTVDFEARLASFDDEEEDGTPSKRSRRQSKDDAWVDILVASSSRRMPGQDADLRSGQRLQAGRSDPELASQEVSEVLASVHHVQSEDEDDDMEPVHRLDAEILRRDDSTVGLSEIGQESVEVTPAPSIQVVGDEEEEPIVATPPKKRLGYFDLHPERRTPKLGVHEEARLEIYEPGPAPQPTFDTTPNQSERNSMYDDPRSLFERPSSDSQRSAGDSSYEGIIDLDAQPPVPLKDTVVPDRPENRHLDAMPQGRNTPSPTIPVADITESRRTPEPPTNKPTQSKTASLIEMYREREKTSSGSVPFPPSRLPVRTGASLSPPPQVVERPVSPAPIPTPEPSPPPSNASLPQAALPIPQPYVHGAPLHNVLEEEEEED